MKFARVPIVWLLLAIVLISVASRIEAQPAAPIDLRVYSYANFNQLNWRAPPSGTISSYLIRRGTTAGGEVQIASVTATTFTFNDNTAGYAYATEFFYTVRALDTGGLTSPDSERVMRFLPRNGWTSTSYQTNQQTNAFYGSIDPYPGQWTSTYYRWQSSPNGGTNYINNDRTNRTMIRDSSGNAIANGSPRYLTVIVGRPDWNTNPNNTFWVSYSTSLPFAIDSAAPAEDTSSSTYFNNSQGRVLADVLPAGGVRPGTFSNDGGGFWRMRRSYSAQERNITDRINAPCRLNVTVIPAGQLAAGRSSAEVRVSDSYGYELPCVIASETSSGGWVTSFIVHFLTSQTINTTATYWVYWGNAAATVPAYSWSNNGFRTSQWDYSPWFSRKLLKAGLDTWNVTTRVITNPPSPADDLNAAYVLPWWVPFWDIGTTTVYPNSNGYISFASYTQPLNTWNEFVGNPSTNRRFIAPFWCNLMVNDANPANSGLYVNNNGTRITFTWQANRFNATTELYALQAVLYRYGDIDFRYENLNFNALWDTPSVSGDNPLNVAPHFTAGISSTDNSRWLGITDGSRDPVISPLEAGLNRNLIHFFQSCHSWATATVADPTNICTMATPTVVAHYDSRVIDSNSSDPTWASFQYGVTGNGGTIDLYVRTGDTTAFAAWALANRVATDVAAPGGSVLNLPASQYLQYRATFKKQNAGDQPTLDWIRFNVGYVTLASVTELMTNVSQGETFPATMTVINNFTATVTVSVASLTFTGGITASQSLLTPLPQLSPFASASIGILVTIATNSTTGATTINGTVTATDGVATLTDTIPDAAGAVTVQTKSTFVIDSIDTTPTQVNKGQGGIIVRANLRNAGWSPARFGGASLTFSLGKYTWGLVSPATGTLLATGPMAFTATFTVTVQPDSPSGLAFLNATASGTNNRVPGMITEATSATTLDSWVIQSPASLAIGLIQAPAIVYRGQTNVGIDLELMNLGEAPAWVSSTPLHLSVGSYTAMDPAEPLPIQILGGESHWLHILVSLAEDTPTGTADIDADIIGSDGNVGTALTASGAAQPTQWKILGEKLVTFKDASHLYPSSSFTRPGSGNVIVYAQAENLAPSREYAIRWFDTAGLEIATATTVGYADSSGKLLAEFIINPGLSYGIYTVKITNPVNTYSPAQTNFAIVTNASVSAAITLPAKVSVGQTFPIRMPLTNLGGAGANGMEPSTLIRSGTGNANLSLGPTPPSLDMTGSSTATFSWNYLAATAGTFQVEGSANGFDANSDAAILVASVTSGVCLIQTPANVSILNLVATPTLVYRNQRNIPVTICVRNTGEADAIIDQASMTFTPAFGSFTLASPPVLPFFLPGNSISTITFDVLINAAAATGLATMTGRIRFSDTNNPILTTVLGGTDTWSIATCTTICARDAAFANQQYSFNRSQTVYVQGTGLPLNTPVRVRFYDDVTPFPPTDPGIGILTPFNTGPSGVVSHQHLIPSGTPNLQTWMIWIDDDLDGDAMTLGTPLVAQYFKVVMNGSFSAQLVCGSSSCFIGDLVRYDVVVTNISTGPTNVNVYGPNFAVAYAPTSVGSITNIATISWGAALFPSGQTVTYSRTYQAMVDSGLTGSTTLRAVTPWQYAEINYGGATNAPTLNAIPPLRIFRKLINLNTATWDFGTCEPGQVSATLSSTLSSLGNHQLTSVKLARVDLRQTATTTIPANNLFVSPEPPLSIGTSSSLGITSRLQIPFNEYPGLYVATMAFYEDHNQSGAFETSDPNDLVEVRVTVASIGKALVVAEEYDLGRALPGTLTSSATIEFVGVGNQPLTRLRFKPLANTTFLPDTPGAFPADGYGTAAVQVSIPLAQLPGSYIATATLFDDTDNDWVVDPGEASDTFRLMWEVGSSGVTITPHVFPYGNGTPTYPLPNLIGSIQNVGEVNLSHLTGQPTSFINLDAPGSVGTDNIALSAPTLVAPSSSSPATTTVYVPGGTGTGTYLATYTWFEDLNGNHSIDPGEVYDRGIATFIVQAFFRIYGLQSTIDLGGVKPGTGKTVPFGIRNAGSLDLPNLNFKIASLSNGMSWLDQSQLAVLPAPYPSVLHGDLAYPSLVASIPATQTLGIFTGEMTVYGDLNTDNVWQPGTEPACSQTVRVEVGDQRLAITSPATLVFIGWPASQTASVLVSLKNTGSLTLSRVMVETTNLTGPSAIASTTFSFSPGRNQGYLLLGQTKTLSLFLNVPWGQDSGAYSGTFWAWEDSNADGIRQSSEAQASAPISLTVNYRKALTITPTSLDLGTLSRLDSATNSFLVQNIGNRNLIDVRWVMVPLDSGGSTIATTSLTMTPLVVGAMATPPAGLPTNRMATLSITIPGGTPDGLYLANFTLYENDWNTAGQAYDAATEASFIVPVRVVVTTPFINASPNPIVLPPGLPTGQTGSATFAINNPGLLTLSRPRILCSDLVNGAFSIASSAISILPSPLSPLAPSAVVSASVSAILSPPSLPPGVYSGTLQAFDDRNNNGLFDVGEPESTVTLQATVLPYPRLSIAPATVDVGNVARSTGSSLSPFTLQNTGNVNIGILSPLPQALSNGSDTIPAASLSFVLPPGVMTPGDIAAGQVQILPIDALQGLGSYLGTQRITDGTASADFVLACEVIPGGPQLPSTVRQLIATPSLDLSAGTRFILSAWVCPGTGTAGLGFLTYINFDQTQIASFGITINANGTPTIFGAPEDAGIIESSSGLHPDFPGSSLRWHRVFVTFELTAGTLGTTNWVMLMNRSAASQPVWFDGVQLERAILSNQARPTAFSPGKKILSPNQKLDLEGGKQYFEW